MHTWKVIMFRLGMPFYTSALQLSCALSLLISGYSLAAGKHPIPDPIAPPEPVTILFTSDIHSHLRPDKSVLQLGGLARLKTAIQETRKKVPNPVLVDGGDWSEGTVYYNEGAGSISLRMMDQMGYDFTVIGNHDWVNGPDVLLDSIHAANPAITFLDANFDVSDYKRGEEFKKIVLPYSIRQFGGVKVAFVGLATYEIVFDGYLRPIRVKEPFFPMYQLAKKLKKEADAIVVISHNGFTVNKALLKFIPDIDVVVGAHNHQKLAAPIVIKRKGHGDGWLTSAEAWGHYLGQVDMRIHPRNKTGDQNSSVDLAGYRLIQIDRKFADDPIIDMEINELEERLEQRFGPIFHDHIADSTVTVNRINGVESPLGNLAVDAYRAVTGAEVGLDHIRFMYDNIYEGKLSTADIYNSIPLVFNPATGKSWTIHTFKMRGKTLQLVLNVIFSNRQLLENQAISVSGLEFLYDPILRIGSRDTSSVFPTLSLTMPQSISPFVHNLQVNGNPIKPDAQYTVAAGTGIVESCNFLNAHFHNLLPMKDMKDTGIEEWKALSDHLRAIGTLTSENLPVGTRARSVRQDLGVMEYEINWTPLEISPNKARARVRAIVRNFGSQPSRSGSTVRLLTNLNNMDTGAIPRFDEIGQVFSIPQLRAGEAQVFEWEAEIPGKDRIFPVTVKISTNRYENNQKNNSVTRWFSGN